MFTLPRQNEAYEATIEGHRSYFPGRNLPDTPFRQYTPEGTVKKEFLPCRSSGPEESVSNEAKLQNWGDLQLKLIAQNVDDMAQELVKIKANVIEEK